MKIMPEEGELLARAAHGLVHTEHCAMLVYEGEQAQIRLRPVSAGVKGLQSIMPKLSIANVAQSCGVSPRSEYKLLFLSVHREAKFLG
jgi:hypothetical protein